MNKWYGYIKPLTEKEKKSREKLRQKRQQEKNHILEIMQKLTKQEKIRIIAYFNDWTLVMAKEWLENQEKT